MPKGFATSVAGSFFRVTTTQLFFANSAEGDSIRFGPKCSLALAPPNRQRLGGRGLEAERIEEHRAIAQRNGERIIANPNVALDAITHGQATFTGRDLVIFVHRHSDGKDQFDAALSAVRGSPDFIALGNARNG
jgi:hypothetical protein